MFGLSQSQVTRRGKASARAAGLAYWEFFSGHSGRVGMARRMAQNGAPTHEIERQGRWKQSDGGRPLHPRRVCRVRAAVFMIDVLAPAARRITLSLVSPTSITKTPSTIT